MVTEDQDLQAMVMTSQKNSPLQYLHASGMQGQVRVAVAQSQVGPLFSIVSNLCWFWTQKTDLKYNNSYLAN